MATPPGQRERSSFPRFGLPTYADRFPRQLINRSFNISVNGVEAGQFDLATTAVSRVSLSSDFHCVTTWTYPGALWSGIRFADFFAQHVAPLALDDEPISGAVLRAQDGYKTSLPIEDLLHDSVLLADELDGQPLSIEHGAPVRLVAPAHYGYKNLKHIDRIEFYAKLPVIKRGVRAFLDHPRARVSYEERGRWLPGWLLRFVYRPLIPGTVRQFAEAMNRHQKNIENR